MDGTGNFWRALNEKEQHCRGGKKVKQRNLGVLFVNAVRGKGGSSHYWEICKALFHKFERH